MSMFCNLADWKSGSQSQTVIKTDKYFLVLDVLLLLVQNVVSKFSTSLVTNTVQNALKRIKFIQ